MIFLCDSEKTSINYFNLLGINSLLINMFRLFKLDII